MEEIVKLGLAVGAVVVILCDSHVGLYIQKRLPKLTVLACSLCTSFWLSLIAGPSQALAVMAVSNIAVLLIRLSMSFSGEDDASTKI